MFIITHGIDQSNELSVLDGEDGRLTVQLEYTWLLASINVWVIAIAINPTFTHLDPTFTHLAIFCSC